ncbi:hypothetical protein ACK9YZ_00595 [Rhizobium sp. ZK1]|uniref:hypothetical protein n=1 Tax=Rhizobium sp. ZK1 TaxID=3389872 RepID=UPI0039F6E8F6
MKKDIPAHEGAGYRSLHKKSGRRQNRSKAPEHRGNTPGDKNKSRRPWKRECNSAHGPALTAIIAPRERILEGAASMFGHRFFGHRFFGRAHYFHDARISGMMA